MEHLAAAAPFKPEELVTELRDALKDWLESIESAFSVDPWTLLGVDRSHSDAGIPPVDHLPITHDLLAVYRYAVFGDPLDEPLEYLTGPLVFMDRALRPFGVAKCLHVLEMGTARWMLDAGEDGLTIDHIALLANMDSKSVRNAANPKRPDCLRTYSSGARTYVHAQDARDWLSRRKGFVPTRPLARQLPTLPVGGFTSVAELMAFVRARMESLGSSSQDLGVSLARAGMSLERLNAILVAKFSVPPADCAAVGSALGFVGVEFALAVTRVLTESTGAPI